MTNQDDILKRLQQQPLVNVAIGVVIGVVLVSLFDKKDNPGIDKRIQGVEGKLKKIQEAEAELAAN